MRRAIIILAILAGVLAATALFGADIRLSVSDLAINSDNPQYKYVGKGIAEMIAVELRKSPDITLIEREMRTALIEEMEFSLSDLADSTTQIAVGRMLAAGYMVFGALIDMGTELLISLRMVDVGSEEIVWNETLTENLSRYDYIAGYFASAILQHFGAEVSRTTQAKITEKSEKDSEAVIALSTAIDLYDRNEDEEAKRQLRVARKIDPESETANYFLTKLTANTTRFKVLMEQYYSYLNPAFLGIMEEDELHLAANMPVYPIVTHNPIEYVNYTAFGTDKAISEMDFNTRLGYAFPIGERWGMRVEVLPTVGSLNRGWQGDYDPDTTELNAQRTAAGAVFDLGFRTSQALAFGAGLGLYARSASDQGPGAPYVSPDKLLVVGNVGFLVRNPDQTLLFDSRLGFNNETYEIIDADTLTQTGEAAAPIYLENTLTLSFQENTTFFIVKQIDSFSLDRSYAFMTAMPAVERFVAPWLSLRAGVEGSLAVLNDSVQPGYGVLAGFTFRFVRAAMDLDLNFTWRQRPSRVVEGVLYTDMMVLMNLTRSGLRVQRN